MIGPLLVRKKLPQRLFRMPQISRRWEFGISFGITVLIAVLLYVLFGIHFNPERDNTADAFLLGEIVVMILLSGYAFLRMVIEQEKKVFALFVNLLLCNVILSILIIILTPILFPVGGIDTDVIVNSR
jgi:prolipoprotein diacylglyceryltransferase